MSAPRTGDILRFTQWYRRIGKTNPILTPGEVMWALVDSDTRQFIPISGHDRVLDPKEPAWRYNEDDDFEIVPPEEWPDEVCVFVAKRQLSN